MNRHQMSRDNLINHSFAGMGPGQMHQRPGSDMPNGFQIIGKDQINSSFAGTNAIQQEVESNYQATQQSQRAHPNVREIVANYRQQGRENSQCQGP